jgi:hypothetical protein
LRAVEIFSGFIHALAINNAGNQIAVAFGTRKVALVQVKDLSMLCSLIRENPTCLMTISTDKRWDLNDICYLPLDDTLSVDGKRPIVKLFFMQNSLVVTFSSPELGIR